jgi:HEAT repeat protein
MLDERQLHKDIQALDAGDGTSTRQVLQCLRDHDAHDWVTAPLEVGHSLVKALQRQLLQKLTPPFIQKDVAAILGNMGPLATPALPQLIALLHRGVPDPVREAAIMACGKIGKQARAAADPLVQLLASARPAVAAHAIRALGNIGCADSRVRAALIDLWLSPGALQTSKAQAAIVLCKLHIAVDNLVATVAKALVTNSEVCLRKAAAEALAWCNKNETDVVPALLTACLTDTNEEVRQLAQAGLEQMHLSQEKAILVCAKQLGESTYAEAALRKSGALAVPALIEALSAREAAVRIKAARTLGCLGEIATEAAAPLTTLLRHPDLEVRLAAAKGLWSITKAPDVVVPALVDLLKGREGADLESSETRRRFLQTVMEALSRIGPGATAARPSLAAMAKDTNRHIREAALVTLEKIAPPVASKTG